MIPFFIDDDAYSISALPIQETQCSSLPHSSVPNTNQIISERFDNWRRFGSLNGWVVYSNKDSLLCFDKNGAIGLHRKVARSVLRITNHFRDYDTYLLLAIDASVSCLKCKEFLPCDTETGLLGKSGILERCDNALLLLM